MEQPALGGPEEEQLAVVSEGWRGQKWNLRRTSRLPNFFRRAEDDVTHRRDAKGLLAPCSAINRPGSSASGGGGEVGMGGGRGGMRQAGC